MRVPTKGKKRVTTKPHSMLHLHQACSIFSTREEERSHLGPECQRAAT